MFSLQSVIHSASSWIPDTFCLPHQCWKLHAWSLCFCCLWKFQFLLPLCVLNFIYSKSYWTLSVPRKRHGLSPFPSQPMPIKFYCLEYFSHLFATVTHCLTPLLGQLITYLLGVILDVTFFTIPLHCTPRQDVLSTCYFKHLLFLSDLKLNHVYFNCLYSSLDCEPH